MLPEDWPDLDFEMDGEWPVEVECPFDGALDDGTYGGGEWD